MICCPACYGWGVLVKETTDTHLQVYQGSVCYQCNGLGVWWTVDEIALHATIKGLSLVEAVKDLRHEFAASLAVQTAIDHQFPVGSRGPDTSRPLASGER